MVEKELIIIVLVGIFFSGRILCYSFIFAQSQGIDILNSAK